MNDSHCHRDYFHEKGLKNTPARDRVIHLLENKVLTAEDVYLLLVQDGFKISFSTVYRILEQFSEHHVTQRVYLDKENKTRYQLLSDHDHHHQLICTACHEVIVIDACPLDSITEDYAKQFNFKIQDHQFVMYGRCQKCHS
jgi:Fur family ferric uptake transcriptional regulator